MRLRIAQSSSGGSYANDRAAQECLNGYRLQYEDTVGKWVVLRAQGVCVSKCAEFIGISRATYYRYKRILKGLEQGAMPPSKALRRCNKPQWGEAGKQLVRERQCTPETFG